ncbi:MAG: TMEM165/GDT1 family protein [Candidatus Heimdallarchaeota archaeon]|nr:TMEM165/GDT1 family protein [Candidatus Heimdallarchaeota archaeon]MCK5047778.1 TMEM165/GDT1 family protein [Candidatus Heimdallarchaeota archaeon]
MTVNLMVESIGISFLAIFLLEFGDKTQIATFALAAKYRHPPKVILGSSLAFLSVTALTLIISIILNTTIPSGVFSIVSGLMFVFIGSMLLYSYLTNDFHDEVEPGCTVPIELCPIPNQDCFEDKTLCKPYLDLVLSKGAVKSSYNMIFLAELGDKSMLAALSLSTQFPPLGVFIGASIALILLTTIGSYAGDRFTRFFPRKQINLISGGIFALIGIAILFFS